MSEKDALIGVNAPNFCLSDAAGHEVCLEAFRGTWVVLYFYPRDNTSGCTLEAVQFNDELKAFTGLGAAIIGVSPDSPESHGRFGAKLDLRFLLLSDPGHRVIGEYGAWIKKVLYGKERFGVERSTFLIDPRGRVVEAWRKVKVPGHAAVVLAALQELRG